MKRYLSFKNLSAIFIALFICMGTSLSVLAQGGIVPWFVYIGQGSGTPCEPFQIKSHAELQDLAICVNYANNSWKTRGLYFELVCDITTPVTFVIGDGSSSTARFEGNFNGNGRKIKLAINRSSGNAALFGKVAYAKIYNLTVEGSVTGVNYVAGIAAEAYGTKIVNCANTANIKGTGAIIGGIAGSFQSYDIIDCRNSGTITGGDYAGGIAGNTTGRIIGCTNQGIVKGNNFVGGITSFLNQGSIIGCLNSGAISGNSAVAGMAGRYDGGNIQSCLNVGTMTVVDQSYYGAIVGHNTQNNVSGILYCYYDSQKCNRAVNTHTGNPNPINITGKFEGKTTAQLTTTTGTNTAKYGLDYYYGSSTHFGIEKNKGWIFISGIYPYISYNSYNTANPCDNSINPNMPFMYKLNSTEESEDIEAMPISMLTVSEVMPSVVNESAKFNVNSTEAGYLNVGIYDVTGSKVMDIADQFIIENLEMEIPISNLSSLSSGMYLVVVTIGDNRVVKQFVKQ